MKNINFLDRIHLLKGSYISVSLELPFFNFSFNNLRMGCKSSPIDSLGFGKSLSVLGKNDTIKYGSETLKPRIRKC